MRLSVTFALWTLPAAFLPACDAPPPTGSQPFSQVIVFGDSLSDTGNLKSESFFLVPGPAYFEGRLSNGRVWVELFAEHFGHAVAPAYWGGANYAHGGSESGAAFAAFGPLQAGPNLLAQLELYAGRPDGTELFVIWFGGNDVFNAVRSDDELSGAAIADNIALAVTTLYARGARHFFVPNLPDIGLTPRYVGGPRQQRATDLCIEANAALAAWLDRIDGLAGIRIDRLDVFSLFNDAVANPPQGVTSTSESAYLGGYFDFPSPQNTVADPDAYLFWDEIHPTRRGHALLADAAIGVIEADPPVPTPAAVPLSFGEVEPPPPIRFWQLWFSYLPVTYAR